MNEQELIKKLSLCLQMLYLLGNIGLRRRISNRFRHHTQHRDIAKK